MPEPGGRDVWWIIGSGGLLGRTVLTSANTAGITTHRSTISWSEPEIATAQLSDHLGALLAAHDRLTIVWCAGAGVVATSAEQLAVETHIIDTFVTEIADVASTGPGRVTKFFLASSAGGVYAGSDDPPFTEAHAAVSISPYGDAKLAAEGHVRRLGEAGVSVLIARIANLYGPGQNLSKPQGLITQLCLSQLRRTPLSIYVSLDTARDYLYVTDAAAMVIAGLRHRDLDVPGTVVVKIFSSQRTTTLASIIGELRRVTKRRPLLVLGASPNARFQTRDLRMKSVVWPELDALATTTLPAGINATLAHVSATLRSPSPA